MKKIAARFKPQLISETLTKLAALDEELKTSQTPPKVLLDLILSQLF
jgi:DNA polymerase III delta subunit